MKTFNMSRNLLLCICIIYILESKADSDWDNNYVSEIQDSSTETTLNTDSNNYVSTGIEDIDALEWSQFVSEVQEAINSTSSYVLPTNNNAFFTPYDDSDSFADYGTYDFIIVGGGTAGGVLANRLTETKFTVLVIEAGKEDPSWAAVLGLSQYFYYSDWNWGYNTTRQQNACLGFTNQQCMYPRGKSLGGTSVINGAVYARGCAADFDNWEKMGNAGWSYKDCLPYFKKSERAEFTKDIDRDYHGFEGLQKIDVTNDTPEATKPLIEAFNEIGKKERDYNGVSENGVSRNQFYLDYNTRTSTAHAFIKPAESRSNLNITLESLVTKIRLSKNKAYGVEFMRNGKKYFANAKREVIVSGGAVNSPQVLMLSGIGPAKELKRHGIDVVADLPVGENLLDTVWFSGLYCRTNHTYYNNTVLENLELWRKNKKPYTAGYGFEIISFWDYDYPADGQPDVEILAGTGARSSATTFQYNDEYAKGIISEYNDYTDLMFAVYLLHPYSSGKVTLQSKDPKDYPLIDTHNLWDERDLATIYKGIQSVLKLNETETFKKWQGQVKIFPFPGCDEKYEKMSLDWWYCGIKHMSISSYHTTGTTRMGTNTRNSVVNAELKVHGIKNLRVVDAGVMPTINSGHPNAVVVMIAEKIADAIKLEHSKEHSN